MTDEHEPEQEPEPGSTEWLLAQLSGGRIDSRRERREAEAALEARGVQFDATTGAIALPDVENRAGQGDAAEPTDGAQQAPREQPATEAAAADEPSEADAPIEERPKARFSWETGTLQAVDSSAEVGDGSAADLREGSADTERADPERSHPASAGAGAAHEATPAAPDAAAPPPVSAAAQQRPAPPLWFDAPDAPPLTFDPTFTVPAPRAPTSASESESQFRWNLLPTTDSDPAVNPKRDVPESAQPVVPPVVPLVPLVPAAAPLIAPKPLSQDLPPAEPDPVAPDAPDAPDNPAAPASPTLLPPGTTAHEFDPFAQDLFAPEAAAGTPVPSVDEFTIPDEERGDEASLATQAMDVAEFLPTQAIPTSDLPSPSPSQNGESEADAAAERDEPEPQVSSNWTDITDMLGAHPETVGTSIVPEWPPPEGTFDGFAQAVAPAADVIAQAVAPAAAARQAANRPASAPVEHRRRLRVNRWLVMIVAVLIAVLVAVLLFAVGRAVAAGHNAAPAAAVSHTASARPSATVSPTPVVSPSVTPSATPALPPTGTLPAGQTYEWDQLRGGECINPFGGAWAQQYAVVDCDSQHAAQLVYTAPYSSNPAAAFPGEQTIASQINLLCSKPGVIDMTAAAAYSDMQLVASYPVTAAQWAAGQRNYYCFVTRSSNQPLTSSVQGPGPGQ